jgi:hypothetical protein
MQDDGRNAGQPPQTAALVEVGDQRRRSSRAQLRRA